MKRFVVGVDAGGTKTEAWAVTTDGVVLERARGGPGNPLTVGVAAAADAIVQNLSHVAEPRGQPSLICIGMAGIGRERERSEVVHALTLRGLPGRGEVDQHAVDPGGLGDAPKTVRFEYGVFGDARLDVHVAQVSRPLLTQG